jgi:uncharacterized membrane protein YesL
MEQENKKQKTAFFRFFELWLQSFWMLVPINFIYFVISALLLPVGLAQAGITNVTRNIARQRHSFGVSDFFDTIKANWKQALIAGIINMLVSLALCFGILFYYNSVGIVADIGLGFLLMCFAVFAFMGYYIWFMIITFDLPLSKIYKNSFLLAFVNLKNNLLLGVAQLALYAPLILVAILIPHFVVLFLCMIVAVFILPGFINLLIQFTIFPAIQTHMLDPYYEAHPEEDISLRQSLSLKTDAQPDEKTAPIFHD